MQALCQLQENEAADSFDVQRMDRQQFFGS